MVRLRRYRYYVFFAAIVVFLLYRVARNSEQWETVSASFPHTVPPFTPKPPPARDSGGNTQAHTEVKGVSTEDRDVPQQVLDKPDEANSPNKVPEFKGEHRLASDHGDGDIELPPKSDSAVKDPAVKEAGVVAYDHNEATKVGTAPIINVPDKTNGQGAKDADNKPIKVPTNTDIHWTKIPEHFPVPASELIPLPTDKPKKIPTIQYAFEKESPTARETRETRQQQVKAEMERSWAGYWKYARGHDELSPVTKSFRDPFCGWAATLVDSLDTLWIMGMEDEFKEALLEVEKIDFTVSKRAEIPVFETTIRYLGGLIAAYDVSSGDNGGYDILLQKAVELAEILMGVFDTPNRMPVLYYNWKPKFASKPKRAGTSVSVAELGSLAMEFTRLAQLTKKNKYYDAVARITDAFYEWQEQGTSIPGIFPEHIDASGCNITAQNELEAAKKVPDTDTNDKFNHDRARRIGATVNEHDELDFESEVNPEVRTGNPNKAKPHIMKRSQRSTALKMNSGKQVNSETAEGERIAGESTLPECVSQGLTPGRGMQQYSMGGSQDSTYEYFPKQWLLLGGLEPKYKELHLKATEAVKKWLLYRPMVPDERDILFSAKLVTRGEPETDANMQYEVTHLTCFIGGMFGMGGKIFEVPADVEIGAKLTEGCVWAYESTATGIMPEGGHLFPCSDLKTCHWNQKLYEQELDPLFESRDEKVQEYYDRKAKAKAAMEKKKKDEEFERHHAQIKDEAGQPRKPALDDKLWRGSHLDHENAGIQKRAAIPNMGGLEDDLAESSSAKGTKSAKFIETQDLEDSDPAPGFERSTAGQVPLQINEDEDEDPSRPLSHEEYVAQKMENEKLPKGFVDVTSRDYILRPEAIESVWYMYRITGDKKWQDKGWKMFKSIVKHTTTDVGNSAIHNVLDTHPTKLNEMESFWTAETLKYFYLLYSEPNLISLDNYVLNTEAHPFKRPKAPFGV
ncbi:glycoside hydrolase family 47 protein [Xylaria bambusicola]|uniref:glycoside hydrolase family 47 protein n=1 Tax=Xylaria bambusicola TaxID=326684 RepID=UPI002008E743|nr:glycoside hydrolase family 47 protein [Xylaria bambusicola]KAI0517804.1 glycoside hydrolase family 47 protein [Xylaria bambusicola]